MFIQNNRLEPFNDLPQTLVLPARILFEFRHLFLTGLANCAVYLLDPYTLSVMLGRKPDRSLQQRQEVPRHACRTPDKTIDRSISGNFGTPFKTTGDQKTLQNSREMFSGCGRIF